MKLFFIILFSIILGTTRSVSQNITFKISDEYESTVQHKDYGYFLGANNSPVNVSYFREHDFSIQPIDLNSTRVLSGISHDITSLGNDAVFEKVINLKDNLFYIYSTVNKKDNTRTVKARLIDDNNKTVMNKNVVLFESTEPKVVSLIPFTMTRYYFTQSTNNEYELITAIYPAREKKAKLNKELLRFCLFDKNLNVVFNKDVEMPYTEQIMTIMDYHVTSKGEVFMLIRVYDENYLGKWDLMPEHTRYELVKVSGNAELQKKDLDLGGRFFKKAKLTDDLKGNLLIAGYYSNLPVKDSRASGIFVFRFGENGSTKVNSACKFYEFTMEMLKSYETEELKDKLDNGGTSDAKLFMDDIFFHPNGDILIVNEQYKNVSNPNGGGSTNYYLDIVALKLDQEGKLLWIKKIPKNQTGAGRSDLSYKYHHYNGSDYFLFIDNENNLNLTPEQAPRAHVCRQGGYLVAVKMDTQGKMQKIPVFDLRKEDISVFPVDLFKVNDNVLIGRCSKDRKKRIMQVTFK